MPPPEHPAQAQPPKAKSSVVKWIGVAVGALVIGLSLLGVFSDLGISKWILNAVGYNQTVQPVAPIVTDDADDAGTDK